MKKITYLMLFLFTAVFANAQISRYIKVDGTGDGTSWANAAAPGSIQVMIDEVAADANQGTVYFAAGTYTLTAQIQLKNNVQLMGGYAADGSGTRDLWKNETILNGNNATRILFTGDQSPYVAFSKITKVDGFILQNGKSSYGSAVAMSVGTVLENCIIRNNAGTSYGAAVFIKRHATLVSPAAGWNFGGALINCVIVNNTSSGYSAGVFVNQDTHFSLVNCVIANNTSTDATNGVGGLYWGQNVRYSRVSNSIFYNNVAPTVARNNIFFQSSGEVQLAIFNNYFSDAAFVDADITTANGNKNATDIASPGFADEANSDWRLSSASGLIGLGSTLSGRADIPYPYVSPRFNNAARAYTTVTTDIMGSTRIIDTNVEMGAYEYSPVTVTVANSDAAKGSVSASVTLSKGSKATLLANNTPPWVFSTWNDGTNDFTAVQSGDYPNFTYTYSFVPSADVTMTANWIHGTWTGVENSNLNSYKIVGKTVIFNEPINAEIISVTGKVMKTIVNETSVNIEKSGVYIIRYADNKVTKVII